MELKENYFPKKAQIPKEEKNEFVELIANYLNQKNLYGFRKVKCNGPKTQSEERDYYGCWVSYKHDPWVFFCWANEFENKYICTPFFIELDEGASKKFIDSGKYKEYCFCRHPRIRDQIIIPIFVYELDNPDNIADKVIDIANLTLEKP